MVMAIWQKRPKQISPGEITEVEIQGRMVGKHGMIIMKTTMGIPQLRLVDLTVTVADQTEPRAITPVAVEWVVCIDFSVTPFHVLFLLPLLRCGKE
jgi:hypothetical protein